MEIHDLEFKSAYIIKCVNVIKDAKGNIVEIHCTYDPETKSGGGASSRKVKGTIHWVSENNAVDAEIRLYDYLFIDEIDDDSINDNDIISKLNPDSLKVIKNCKVEPILKNSLPGEKFQFLRQGYFCADLKDHNSKSLVFNRIVPLKDTWAKIKKQ